MARKVQLDDLFRLILPGSPALSPDGRQLAFTVRRVRKKENRYESHLWMMPARGGRPRQLTRGLVLDSAPAWSPDGRELAFVSDREGRPNVWILPLAGGEPRPVTSLGGGPITSLSWSPDGRELLFAHFSVPKVEDSVRKGQAHFKHVKHLYHKEDGFGWFGDETWTIWRTNVRSGRSKALTPGFHHDDQPRWSPDGKKIAFVSRRGEHATTTPDLSTLMTMDRTGGRLRDLTPTSGGRSLPRWSGDGRHLYWVGYEGGAGEWLRHEFTVNRTTVAGGKTEALNPGHDRWVMNMVGSDTTSANSTFAVYESDGEERVLFGSDEDGSYRLYSVPGTGGTPRLEVGGRLSVLDSSTRGDQCVYCAATTGDTGEMYAVRLDGTQESRPLTRVTAPFFRPLVHTKPEEFRFRSGKTELQGWVLKPPGFRAGRRYPCLIQVHGGPMTQYGEAWFHEMHVLAAQGWVVAYCNPRGSSGRGQKFCNVIEGKWGKDDWADVQALTNTMARRSYVDAKRIGILGGSYGGFMTSWAVGHTQRYRAAITMRTAGDFWVHWGSSDIGHYRTKYFGGQHPWDNPMAYHRASPTYYAKNIKTPLLIIHSEGDLRCPIGEGEMLFTAMKVLDQAPCEMVRFEGEFHGLSRGGKPRNREERLKRIVDWFQRYL
ncbi:MAG: peptidase [Gemmatimonadota bacterium]|nr:MAG: peptidase [Gemmatimonadota bacterium]